MNNLPMFNGDYEKAIIGGLLIDNNSFEVASQYVDSSDMYIHDNEVMYNFIADLINRGEQANIITVGEKFGASKVTEMTQIPTAGNMKFYCERVRELSIRRKALVVAEKIKESANNISKNIEEVVEDLSSGISSLSDRKAWTYNKAGALLGETISVIEKLYHSRGMLGLSTGYSSVDNYTGGFIDSEVTVIGARASIGKTALALNMAENMAKRGVPVGFISLEMAAQLLVQRMVCSGSGVGVHSIRTGKMVEGDFAKINDAAEKIYSMPLYIYDYPNTKLTDIKLKARLMCKREGIKALFVDYIGLIRTSKNVPRWEEVGFISSELKALARELKIPVIVLAQVNRDAEGKAPTLANLRESGSIEQDADVVMFLHRRRESQESSLYVSKNRNGGTGKIELTFVLDRTRFYETEHNFEQQNGA